MAVEKYASRTAAEEFSAAVFVRKKKAAPVGTAKMPSLIEPPHGKSEGGIFRN